MLSLFIYEWKDRANIEFVMDRGFLFRYNRLTSGGVFALLYHETWEE
jgi:hypothetical protein